jgi:SAM-dependent MidA family methyltransferase
MRTRLAEEIRSIISAEGPIPVSRYMALCLHHPRFGYYATGSPIGAAGDFITAPEVSQMFGELLGAWAAATWRLMQAPERVRLIELGPGRGTLMADALRAAARAMPTFWKALCVDLVEINPDLRAEQERVLAGSAVPLAWWRRLADVPVGPSIVFANEFLDAMPIEQAVRSREGWHARKVGVGADGTLCFAFDPLPLPEFEHIVPLALHDAPIGSVFEWRDGGAVAALAARIAQHGGAALIIDYGHRRPALGDTLQAVIAHRRCSPLEAPGQSDLTAHVDFAAVGEVARQGGLRVFGPLTQGDFLRHLGIELRAAALKQHANASQQAEIDAAVARLTGTQRDEMGGLFKVIGLAGCDVDALPGFDS